MTTRTDVGPRTRAGPGVSPGLVTGILGGLLGGVLFAMWMMLEGYFDEGLFSAPTSIWAFWAGPDAYHAKDFALVPFFLGAMGHMMNAIILGAAMVFVGWFGARGAIPTLAVAMVKALVIMALMFGVVLRLSPYGDIVYHSAPLWSWIVGHLMFGLGIWWVAWRRRQLPG